MTGGVDEVEHIFLAIIGLVIDAHGVRLDGDAALALDIHTVEQLRFHIAPRDRARLLDEAVSKGGFTVVDMRHDGEIADFVQIGHAPDMMRNRGPVKMASYMPVRRR